MSICGLQTYMYSCSVAPHVSHVSDVYLFIVEFKLANMLHNSCSN